MSEGKCNCGCMGAGPLVTEFIKKMGPSDEVGQHFKAARLEILKGLRAMLDEQSRARMKRVLALIEPVAILMIGGIIGVFVTAIILAITSVNTLPL